MKKTPRARQRNALSREQIIQTAITILDDLGEAGLTFQALARSLATGAGAIYWHVENKDDLLIAACDVVIERALDANVGLTPEEEICSIGLGIFDALDLHPWMGSVLSHAAGSMPTIRIIERIGNQVRALNVVEEWSVVSALLSYIVGVAAQNAANAQFALRKGLNRSKFLGEIATLWAALDPDQFPFTSSIASKLPGHDDRADFVAGIRLLVGAIRRGVDDAS
ncbi:TetR family transcriptional regulator [Rhizobium sp. S152]|uniref:TetR/AcrR family transcriptional regulator n=1 Tax=Rhizobium sp. S152 TaxID=3055038 RepID=UPI0025A9EDB5|nr:TetR family transcriptional regulator [Rhizobium sp. S152]MDM9627644.1 TetR family transcriptional regulator [Rhizobium sp. S152]